MAYAEKTKCRLCGKPVDFVIVALTGKAMSFDNAGQPIPEGRTTRWVQFPDPRTGTPRARHLEPGEHLEPDDELILPHYQSCAAIQRNDHDR